MAYAAIEGSRALYANLDFLEQFATEMMPITLEEMNHVADEIAEEAKRLAPVLTGHLRDNISVIRGRYGVEIYSAARYSLFVEFGTSKMAAQPFLRVAYHKYSYFKSVAARLRDELHQGLAIQ